jgi:hypothetical protein
VRDSVSIRARTHTLHISISLFLLLSDVIQLAESNIQLNSVNVTSQVLRWGLLDAIDYIGEADLVVGSDLTYNSGTWRVLAETMSTIVSDNGHVLYLSLGHDGFNVNAEMDGFLSVAKEQGLMVATDNSIGGVAIQKLLDRIVSMDERKLVLQTGVRVVVLCKKKFTKKYG